MLPSAHWDRFVQKNRQGHKEIDQLIQNTQCWRCGQQGRLPIEDAPFFVAPPTDTHPGSEQALMVVQKADRLFEARRAAVNAWKRYNDRRLETELLRFDANYHPMIADRFEIKRNRSMR